MYVAHEEPSLTVGLVPPPGYGTIVNFADCIRF